MGGRGASAGKTGGSANAIFKPTQAYSSAYDSYMKKMFKASGTTENPDKTLNYGQKEFSGQIYTNDEFFHHLEDGNWHSLSTAIIENKLTNAQVTELKNNMKLGLWSFGNYKNLNSTNFKTTKDYVNTIIKDVKASKPAKTTTKSKASSSSTRVVGDNYKRINNQGGAFGTTYAVYKGGNLVKIVGTKAEADKLIGKTKKK